MSIGGELVEFGHLDLIRSALERAGHDLVRVDRHKIEYGNLETLTRYASVGGTVSEWKGDHGWGSWTGTEFAQPIDAERWIMLDAGFTMRSSAGFSLAHWLFGPADSIPESFTVDDDGGRRTSLSWTVGGEAHQAWFQGPVSLFRAGTFTAVARVPLDRIEECALELDARSAFRAVSDPALADERRTTEEP